MDVERESKGGGVRRCKEDLAAMQSRQRINKGNGKSVVTRIELNSIIKALWHDLEEFIPRIGVFNLEP